MGLIATVAITFLVILIVAFVSRSRTAARDMKALDDVERDFVEAHGREMTKDDWDDYWRRHPHLANKPYGGD